MDLSRRDFMLGGAAVHSDMLMWNPADTPENAARFVLSSIFGTVQYSVMLRTLPEGQRRMLAHWIGFAEAHRGTLLKGRFRPHGFGLNYPVIEAEIYDTFGDAKGKTRLNRGIQRVTIPQGGYAMVRKIR